MPRADHRTRSRFTRRSRCTLVYFASAGSDPHVGDPVGASSKLAFYSEPRKILASQARCRTVFPRSCDDPEIAVLVVEPERTVLNVSRSDLPNEAGQGDVLRLEGHVDRKEMDRRREEVREKIEQLRRRGRREE